MLNVNQLLASLNVYTSVDVLILIPQRVQCVFIPSLMGKIFEKCNFLSLFQITRGDGRNHPNTNSKRWMLLLHPSQKYIQRLRPQRDPGLDRGYHENRLTGANECSEEDVTSQLCDEQHVGCESYTHTHTQDVKVSFSENNPRLQRLK